MADLSKLSDQELIDLYQSKKKTSGSLSPPSRLNPDTKAARERIAEEDKVFGTSPSKALDNFFLTMGRSVPGAGTYLDEAIAGTKTLGGTTGNYGEELAYQRERARQYEKESPIASTTAKVGGTVGGAALEAKLLKRAAPRLVPEFDKLTRAGKIKAGAKLGGGGGLVTGTVGGFGEGEGGLVNRLQNAGYQGLFDAITGTLLGGAAPFVGGGLSATASKLGFTKDRINELYGKLGLSKPSSEMLQDILSQDDALSSVGKGTRNVAQAGPDAMLADTGKGSRAALDYLASKGGAPARTVEQATTQRLESTSGRFMNKLDELFGTPQGTTPAKRAIKEGTDEIRDVTYKKAYAINPDYASPVGKEIQTNLQRISPSHWNEVWEEARDKGIKITPAYKKQAMNNPTTQDLDIIKRSLDGIASKSQGQGKMGGMTPEGHRAQRQAQDIRELVKSFNQPYREALELGKGTIEQTGAVEFGKNLLRPRMELAEARLRLTERYGGNTQEALQGVSNHINQVMTTAKKAINSTDEEYVREATKAVRELSSSDAQAKLSLLLPPERISDLMTNINQMQKALLLKLNQGSQTAIRNFLAEKEAGVLTDPARAARKEIGGGAQTIAGRLLTWPFGKSKTQMDRELNQFRKQIAGALTNKKPEPYLRDVAKLRARERAAEHRQQRFRQGGAQTAPLAVPGLLDLFSTPPAREEE